MLPEELVAIGKEAGVPVFIDAASELPPAGNLTRYVQMGADLVASTRSLTATSAAG